jgi:hypothetical protein
MNVCHVGLKDRIPCDFDLNDDLPEFGNMEVADVTLDPTASTLELEEGEIAPGDVPEPRWEDMTDMTKVPYGFNQDYVKSFQENPDLATKEQRIADIEGQVLHNEDLHLPKVFIPSPLLMFYFQVGKRRKDNQKSAYILEWSLDDMKSFNMNHYPIPTRNEDNSRIANLRGTPIVKEDCVLSFFTSTLYWDFISDKNAPSYDTVIQSWLYDDDLRLFVLKRRDGCQYLPVIVDYFKSLSADDLFEIGKKELINPNRNGSAAIFGTWLYRDYRSRFADEDFDVNKLFIKPRKKKKITRDDGRVEYIQKPIDCLTTVPARKWEQNILSKLDNWEIDKNTGFAKMFGDAKKTELLLSMYDPMQIVNLSRSDLRKLDDITCKCVTFWNVERDRYRKLIRICLREDIHANSRRLLGI